VALYFSEHPEAPVRINLPVGSYKAEFHFQSPLHENSAGPWANQSSVLARPEVAPPDPGESLPGPANYEAAVPEQPGVPGRAITTRWLIAAAVLLIVVAATLGNSWLNRGRREFWWPVLRGDVPALILVGKTDLPGLAPAAAWPGQTAASKSAGQLNLVLEDAVVAAQICSAFREYHRDCDIVAASQAKVEDLRGKSVVLVGGFNNPWTDRLLAPLPYQFHGESNPDARSIIEHEPSGNEVLGRLVGEDTPTRTGKDYAIVARFHSDVTDSMAVVVAGMGIPGTTSAGQYLSSSKRFREILSRAPKDWDGVNFEAVIEVDVVQGSAGHVDVIATHFW